MVGAVSELIRRAWVFTWLGLGENKRKWNHLLPPEYVRSAQSERENPVRIPVVRACLTESTKTCQSDQSYQSYQNVDLT